MSIKIIFFRIPVKSAGGAGVVVIVIVIVNVIISLLCQTCEQCWRRWRCCCCCCCRWGSSTFIDRYEHILWCYLDKILYQKSPKKLYIFVDDIKNGCWWYKLFVGDIFWGQGLPPGHFGDIPAGHAPASRGQTLRIRARFMLKLRLKKSKSILRSVKLCQNQYMHWEEGAESS